MKKTSVADDGSTLFSKDSGTTADEPAKKAKSGANRINAALTRQKKVSTEEPKK